MTFFGRMTARQRLRRATRESLAIPAFSSPVDCTPWVTGGLWPAELTTVTAETATLADYLRADLQRIADSANRELSIIKRAGIDDPARRAEEARVIGDARARAVQRVESTIRQLHAVRTGTPPPVGARVADEEPVVNSPTDIPKPPAIAQYDRAAVGDHEGPETAGGRHRAASGTTAQERTIVRAPRAVDSGGASESDDQRLRRLLWFVAHQEPRLNWAVGQRSDGTVVLVTDLAHGWIPPGIALPAGVRLLAPDRRPGRVAALIGDGSRTVMYRPGDPLRRLDDVDRTEASAQPRELPPIADPGSELSQATHLRAGLPRLVHSLARAAAAGTRVAEDEIDLLRVHLDTARYQLLSQYPNVDPPLLLNCLLLAATEGAVTADPISANYHLAWFKKLGAPTDGA
ncbi:DUF5631 domain-containing protein [Mycobacterium sp.]|uniref:DUF5631 domain-containing protein n=1 Tax=Mycobacterium sp. TaxID=1785 RepID=UPI0025F7A322|nr:DUF5631 domain-containing protein [Mycobacterium sp.]MBW0013512.1 DUF5631 domain-containing protein [Mycobacterium sp.]